MRNDLSAQAPLGATLRFAPPPNLSIGSFEKREGE